MSDGFYHLMRLYREWKSHIQLFSTLTVTISVYTLLSSEIVHLGLLLDDYVRQLPAQKGNYIDHLRFYISAYGFFRPLEYVFYYVLYKGYQLSPALAHLFLFFIHCSTSFLVYHTFSYSIKRSAFILAAIYLVFPFFTEQYGWLAASAGIVVNSIIFIECVIVLSERLSLKHKLAALITAQIIGVLMYETCFFVFIPMSLLMGYIKIFNLKKTVIVLLFNSIPSFAYYAIRILILSPLCESCVRELSVNTFFTDTWIVTLNNNVNMLIDSTRYIFLNNSAWENFWFSSFLGGIKIITQKFSLSAITIFFVLSTCILSLTNSTTNNNKKNYDVYPRIWFILSICTLLPAVFLKQASFPFRVIALPCYFLLSTFLVAIERYSIKIYAIITASILVLFLPMSLNMLYTMKIQSQYDKQMLQQIIDEVDRIGPSSTIVNLIINRIGDSSQSSLVYGEYAKSCLSVDWCIQGAIATKSSRMPNIRIYSSHTQSHLVEHWLVFKYLPHQQTLIVDWWQ